MVMRRYINKDDIYSSMDSQSIKELILEQKKEFEKQEHIIPRTLLQNIKNHLTIPHAIIISGVRRSGKSTLLKEIYHTYYQDKIIYYFNFEDERLLKFTVDDFNLLYETFLELLGDSTLFFFDEIQVIPHWEAFVRRMYNSGCKFFITGSNSSMLSKEMGTKLTGRSIAITLYPFSFTECLLLHNIQPKNPVLLTDERAQLKKEFNTYLEKGGFPEYRLYNNNQMLKDLYENILYRDVIARYHIADEKTLKELSFYLFSNYGKEISYNQLKNLLKTGSANTIKNYIEYLENAYLVFSVPKYDPSVKKQIYSKKKIYAIDTGLINCISFQFSKNMGRILENTVFLELKRKNKDIYYYKNKYECDFVITDNRTITQAIQVTQEINDTNKERETKGLFEVLKRFNLPYGLILTYDQEEEMTYEKKKIFIQPVWKWLLEKEPREMKTL
jgi:predicted AAA+ superfamily ATPase